MARHDDNDDNMPNRLIGLVGSVFVNGPGDLGSIPVASTKDFKNGTWYPLA